MTESNEGAGQISTLDPELQAIQGVLIALTPLSDDARARVVTFAFGKLGLQQVPFDVPPPGVTTDSGAQAQTPAPTALGPATVVDIRSFKEAKRPQNSTEMAVLLAYYLNEVAPPTERKGSISSDDVDKYFKQAGFPLPGRTRQTLSNAKRAGYLDNAQRGEYKLNPVGHNLVAHTLPRDSSGSAPSGPKRKAKAKGRRNTTKKARKASLSKRRSPKRK